MEKTEVQTPVANDESLIKTAFKDVYAYLKDHKNDKVGDIFTEITAFFKKKNASNSRSKAKNKAQRTPIAIYNMDGVAIAIKCYYYKRWMPLIGPNKVEFGSKKGSTTGYNVMCKDGNAHYIKQLNESKQAREQMLVDLENGTLAVKDISKRKQEIEDARSLIAETENGFPNIREVIEYLEKNGEVVNKEPLMDPAAAFNAAKQAGEAKVMETKPAKADAKPAKADAKPVKKEVKLS